MFKKFTEKLKASLAKTKEKILGGLKAVMPFGRALDQDTIDQMEEYLYSADIGPATVQKIVDEVQSAYKDKRIRTTDECFAFLKETLKAIMADSRPGLRRASEGPTVILVAGVNGSGKTTSIAKLTQLLSRDGKKVVLGAADTFRAAAVEQLSIWADRLGAQIVKKGQNADPASVAFDACDAARARAADYVIIDTAGRLHTQKNLMQELEKIKRVISQKIEGGPHEVLLILDANNGQNAIEQARRFTEAIDVTGLFLTKLDGTAKGGAVIGIRHEIAVPVKFIGVGEKAEDIEEFDPDSFVEALFS
ncbi:MAG: signal recognition particle-docking protein FtsY [Planctomycetes bacterium]|nr:signal recognition particle-docking protein FtsY [Planctomycetota bacterium]